MKVRALSINPTLSKIITNPVLAYVFSNIEHGLTGKNTILPGWRCYLEFYKSSDPKKCLSYSLTNGDNYGNYGTYAAAKLDTLKAIAPNSYHTGSTNMQDLLAHLPVIDDCDCNLIKELKKIDHPASVPMPLHQRIKSSFGRALMYGAIRIPVTQHTIDNVENYELLISFSGGSQEQDLIIAFQIFREFQGAFWQTCKDSWFTYLLEPLCQDQRCNFTINLLGLEEKIPK